VQDEDDNFDDDASFGEPLHPDDRLWRHPSEMRDVPAPGSRSIPDIVDFAPAPTAPRGRGGWTLAVASGLVGASAVLLVVLATGMTDRVVERSDDAADQVTVTSTVPVSVSVPSSATEAIAVVRPSVALIAATNGDTTTDGTALVLRPDGYLLTDAHLLEGAAALHVTLADGTTLPATVVAIDPVTALGVVHVDRLDLVPATLGDPSALDVGQLTMAIGTDTTGGPSISSGVISAFEERSTALAGTLLYGLIRVDAPLSDGAAGGPLITETGEVVGVTVKSDPTATFSWATPIDDATDVATELIEDGRARHPWLGVEGRRTAEGASVMAVMENSPASEAGLQVDDVLVSVDGRSVPSMAILVAIIREHEPGDDVTITYRRDGITWTCVATLGLSS
jgi:putative serine protease PepD